MKRITILFALVVSVAFANAQISFSPTRTNATGAVLNATTDTLNLQSQGYSTMTVQALLTKTSGTVAGTVRLYGSNYNNTTGAWEPVGDTLTLANAATNKHTWVVTTPYRYYQLLQSGGTTVAGILSAKVFGIKQ